MTVDIEIHPIIGFIEARLEQALQEHEWHEPWCSSVGHDEHGCDCTGPRQILRDIEAKRLILREHRQLAIASVTHQGPECYSCCHPAARCTPRAHPCRTVRALASVWSDHPDWQEGWKP